MKDEKLIELFVSEMDEKLSPLLRIENIKDRNHPHFELVLRDNKFVMEDQVVLKWNDEFENLVIDVGRNYFDCKPGFNNTSRVFWFI